MVTRPRTKALKAEQFKGELKGDLAAYEKVGLSQRYMLQLASAKPHDQLILRLTADAGLRRDEVVNLKLSNVEEPRANPFRPEVSEVSQGRRLRHLEVYQVISQQTHCWNLTGGWRSFRISKVCLTCCHQCLMLLGKHNEYVLKNILKMSDEEMAQLVIDGVLE